MKNNKGNTRGITIEGSIQHKCGVPDKPEARMKKESAEVDKAFRAFFSRAGRIQPRVNGYFVDLGIEQDNMANEY
jgi:hypothetical protein